jgi:N-methylhydantoinase A/acetophenone carboxylase
VAKTRALSTYNSGPVAGLVGADRVRQLYNLQNVISTDMGGTSLDMGLIRDGKFSLELNPVISGLRINQAMIEIKAVGAGGGSIAQTVEGKVEVGPESAGSLPGPACFDRGGLKPTVTDADLVLGFIDPDYFLGGRIKLNRNRAVEVIHRDIAKPLGITVEEAAAAIRQEVDAVIAGHLQKLIDGCGQGWRPQAIFAYGGAGPTHCCGYTAGLPVEKIVTSPYSPVFSAFGLGQMDVVHKYSFSREIYLTGIGNEEKAELINISLERLKITAQRDMRGEGFKPEEITFYLELFVGTSGSLADERILISNDTLTAADLDELSQKFTLLSAVVLNAVVVIPHLDIPKLAPEGIKPARAKTGFRQVYWPEEKGYLATGVYRRELLRPGNVITGPAVIESVDTTCVIPTGFKYTIDSYMNGIIEGVD